MKIKLSLYFIIPVTVLFVSCSDNVIFSQYTEIKDGVWAKDRSFGFKIDVEDTVSTYEIDILLRNTDVFPRQNLWLSIAQEFNGQEVGRDTVDIFLLDEDGKWRGSGLGSGYDNQFVWKQHVRFPRKGSYVYRFSQLMRIDVLEGIERIGIEVTKEK